MSGFTEGIDRSQVTLFPAQLEDWICEDNPVRIVDVFVDALGLVECGFERTSPARTGRPGYEPAVLLKLFIYGYLNRVPSSRRLCRQSIETPPHVCHARRQPDPCVAWHGDHEESPFNKRANISASKPPSAIIR